MKKIISPFNFSSEVCIPASKSYLQRAIALAAFCEEESVIENVNFCNDVLSAVHCAEQLGASVKIHNDVLIVKGRKPFQSKDKIIVNAGESGFCARVFGIIAPALFEKTEITGTGSILNRSMQSLITVLEKLGCNVISKDYRLPIYTQGFADCQLVELTETDTSQTITGLLYAALISGQSCNIKVHKMVSIPYVQLSLDLAKIFGIHIEHNADYTEFDIQGHQKISNVHLKAEGDWSNAAFFAVAAALSGKCKLLGLNKNSWQGDKVIQDVLQLAGAKVFWEDDKFIVEKNDLKPFEFDLKDYPDLFPPLCVLALGIKGKTVLYGVNRLINKESNRAEVLAKEFSKVGGEIIIEGDKMQIFGKGYLNGGVIDSHNDHRIAMAAAISAVISKDDTVIENAEAVNKSYPQFFEHLFEN